MSTAAKAIVFYDGKTEIAVTYIGQTGKFSSFLHISPVYSIINLFSGYPGNCTKLTCTKPPSIELDESKYVDTNIEVTGAEKKVRSRCFPIYLIDLKKMLPIFVGFVPRLLQGRCSQKETIS